MDRLQLDPTAITGNRELPKVMSIVPWKAAEPPGGPDRPMGSLIDELLAPLDRDEFLRPETTLESLGQLKPSFQEQGEKYGFNSVIAVSTFAAPASFSSARALPSPSGSDLSAPSFDCSASSRAPTRRPAPLRVPGQNSPAPRRRAG